MKGKFLKLFLAFAFGLGISIISIPSQAYYAGGNCYYRHGHYVCYHGNYYYHHYRHCRYVDGYWHHGYWHPGRRVCWY